MLKKITILICFLFFSVSQAEALLGDNLGLNLYKEIDKGFFDIQKTQIKYELKGSNKRNSLSENINRQLKLNGFNDCLKNTFTLKKYENIIKNDDLELLLKEIKEECISNNKIDISNLNIYLNFLKKYYSNTEIKVINKTKQIYEIYKIGIFLDGDKKNSGFDLISDLQDIDKVIFGEKLEYNGTEDYSFLKIFEKEPNNTRSPNSDNSSGNNSSGNNSSGNNSSGNNSSGNNSSGNNSSGNNSSGNNNLNPYLCIENINNTGLDLKNFTEILNEFSNSSNNNSSSNNSSGNNSSSNNSSSNSSSSNNSSGNELLVDEPQILNSNYNIENDDSQWKCSTNDFFCTTIDFTLYKQKLLGYGQTKSISELVKVSNGHLKKGVNTSLAQSKMSINNFENILKDINFQDMFHIGIVLTEKTPPLLKLSSKAKKEDEKPIYKKTLEKIYKNQGLDYKRKNDLLIISKQVKELREIINSSENSPTLLKKQKDEKYIFVEKLKAENEFINSNKSTIINNHILKNFYNQLIEYERFIGSLESYTNNILPYIKKLYNIPRGD